MTTSIIDTITGEVVYDGPAWGATDALVNHYCDNRTPREVYDACTALGDAIAAGDYTGGYEAYLACRVR